MIFTKIMGVFEWVMYFAFLNVLFVGGVLAGGVIFGIFPASFATISIAKRLVNEPGFHLGKAFWSAYKAHFWKSQRVGYAFSLVNVILGSNVIFWRQIFMPISWAWLVIFILFALGSLLLFGTTVENHYTVPQIGKLFFHCLSQLHLNVALLLGLVVVILGTLLMPGIFIFFSGSLILTWVMFVNHLYVRKIEKVKNV